MVTKGVIDPDSEWKQYIDVRVDHFSYYIVIVLTPKTVAYNAVNSILHQWPND